MTWDVTDLGFKMGLSPAVPDVLARHARPVVEELLGRPRADGRAGRAAGRCTPAAGASSRSSARRSGCPTTPSRRRYDVLRDVGNCSSATVLLVLERLAETVDVPAGGHVVAMAFGPGLTLYAALLRRRS